MTNKKITKQDLLSMCLGCDSCNSALYVHNGGSLYYTVNGRSFILIKRNNSIYTPYTFLEEYIYSNTIRITTTEELKKAMRHDYYLYDV